MLWILLGFLVLGGIMGVLVYFNSRSQQANNPVMIVREAISTAKKAMLDKEEKPEVFQRLKNKEEIPYDSKVKNKLKEEIPGTWHFRCPEIEIGYTMKDGGAEKMVLQIHGHEEVITLFYTEGILSSIKVRDEILGTEAFEMRQAGTIAEQLRNFVRYHLRFPGGSLQVTKSPEPTFTPKLNLKKGSGQINLKGPKPPDKQPNFQDE
jgi:hypothetical protein